MSNQDRIKEYLVGKNGYLKSEISNGKVIMLSGKWGSGKTHFWQNLIATDELKKELKNKREVYSYISLYGKTSTEEIENDIFYQAYSSAIGGENFVTKGFSTFTKRMKRFGSTKIANGLKEEQQDNIERTALSRLNNGGIICFDDFERKSKEIDLNDLFGFITQLTLNFQCKVVIILNDDAFEGEEKNIFSNVKEKTVSKFLYYNPTIEELFNLIFCGEKYKNLSSYKEVILKTIKKTGELNARIYIQVLDNLLDWITHVDENEKLNHILQCLVFVNINFISNHIVFRYDDKLKLPTLLRELKNFPINSINVFENNIDNSFNNLNYELEVIMILKNAAASEYKNDKPKENLIKDLEKIERYGKYFWIFFKYYKIYKYKENISNEQLEKINDFIETGILI